MSSEYYNPGKVDIEKAVEGIRNAGGGTNVQHEADHDHHVAYAREKGYDRHFSYDEYPDGTIKNVHTDKDGEGYMTYGGGYR